MALGINYQDFTPQGVPGTSSPQDILAAKQTVQNIIGGINGATGFNPNGLTAAPAPTANQPASGSPDVSGTGYFLGGSTDTAARANEASYWQDQIDALNRLLGSSNVQRDQGLANIDQGYNNQLARTNQDESSALSQYATQRDDTTHDKLGALDQVDSGARNLYGSLQRLLGAHGAGVSSAAQVVAPYAVSRNASQQRSGVQDTFGRNLRDIDTAETGTKSEFQRALDDLLSQAQGKRQDFMSGILSNQNDLSQKLADAVTQKSIAEGGDYQSAAALRAPFQQQISSRMSALDNLFNQYKTPTFNVAPVSVKTPDLGKYTVDQAKVQTAQQNPGLDSSVLPFLSFLKKQQQQPALA